MQDLNTIINVIIGCAIYNITKELIQLIINDVVDYFDKKQRLNKK